MHGGQGTTLMEYKNVNSGLPSLHTSSKRQTPQSTGKKTRSSYSKDGGPPKLKESLNRSFVPPKGGSKGELNLSNTTYPQNDDSLYYNVQPFFSPTGQGDPASNSLTQYSNNNPQNMKLAGLNAQNNKLRQALKEKDNLIKTQRHLIKELYDQINEHENNVKMMMSVVGTLKKTLQDYNIPLPQLKDEEAEVISEQLNTSTNALRVASSSNPLNETNYQNESEQLYEDSSFQGTGGFQESSNLDLFRVTTPQESGKQQELDKFVVMDTLNKYFKGRGVGAKRGKGKQSRLKGRGKDEMGTNSRPNKRSSSILGGGMRSELSSGGRPQQRSFASPNASLKQQLPNVHRHAHMGGGTDNIGGSSPSMQSKDIYAKMDPEFKHYVNSELAFSLLDTNLMTNEIQILSKYLLGVTAKDSFMEKTRRALMNTLALYFICKNVAYNSSFQTYLPRLTHMIMHCFEVQRVIIYLFDPAEQLLLVKASSGHLPDPFSLTPTQGLVGFAFSRGTGLHVENAYEDPRFDPNIDKLRKSITKNIVIVPIKLNNHCIGCLEVANKLNAGTFSASNLKALSLISLELASGVFLFAQRDRIQTYRAKEIEYKEQVAQNTKEAFLRPLIRNYMKLVADIYYADKVVLFMKNDEGNELIGELAATSTTISKLKIKINIIEGCAGESLRTGEVIFEQNMSSGEILSEIEYNGLGVELRNIIAIPISNSLGEPCGVLEILNSDRNNFSSTGIKSQFQKIGKYLSLILFTNQELEGTMHLYNRLSVAINLINDSVIFIDNSGLVSLVNKSAAILLRLKQESMVGRSITEVFSSRNGHLLEAYYKLLETGESQIMENSYLSISYQVDKNTHYMDISINYYCLFLEEEGNNGVLFVIQPIVVKKK